MLSLLVTRAFGMGLVLEDKNINHILKNVNKNRLNKTYLHEWSSCNWNIFF